MPRGTSALVNFTAGEVSPLLDGRSDLAFYGNACRLLENFIVLPQGGATRRPGTRHVAAAKSGTGRSRLVPFEFSTVQAYVLEFAAGVIRFYKDKGQITVEATSATINNGSFTSGIGGWNNVSVSTGSISHDALNGRLNLIGGGSVAQYGAAEQPVGIVAASVGREHVLRFTVPAGPLQYGRVLLSIGSTTGGAQFFPETEFAAGEHCVAFVPTSQPAYVRFKNNAPGETHQVDDVRLLSGEPLEMSSPYGEADLPGLRYAQSADVMYLAHVNHPVRKLSRKGHSTWSVGIVDFRDGPYLEQNTVVGYTLTPSATTGNITITATNANTPEAFLPSDIGRLIRIRHGSTWGVVRLTGWTSLVQMSARVLTALGGATATAEWRAGLYSARTGFPKTVKFYDERLIFAGSPLRPQRIDGSRAGDFETFAPGTNAADAISYNIASDQVNAIHWLVPTQDLVIGTAGSPFRARGDTENAIITPTNIQIRRQTRRGCAEVEPAVIESVVLYVGRDGRTLYELVYSFETNSYVAQDMTVRSEHIGRGGMIEIAWQQHPWNCLWAVRADGTLLGFTYMREQQVAAWHRHRIGGDGLVESIATIPGDRTDQLWLVVRRPDGAGVRRTVEILEAPLDVGDDPIEAFHLDGGITYDGRRATSLAWSTPAPGERSFVAGAAAFAPTDVGREIRVRRYVVASDGSVASEENHAGAITAYVSPTEVRAAVAPTVPASGSVPAGGWGLTAANLSGAAHLDPFAAALQGLADGLPIAPVPSGGGQYGLPAPALVAHLGLPYVSRLKPMQPESLAEGGTAQGQRKRIDRLTVRLYNTGAVRVGRDAAHLDALSLGLAAGPGGTPPRLRTGDSEAVFRGDWDTRGDVLVLADQPVPCTVLGLYARIATNGG